MIRKQFGEYEARANACEEDLFNFLLLSLWIYSAIGGEITSDGDFLIFEGNRYSRKGFLYKNFLITAILSEGVKPTLAELERFEEQPEGM